MPVATAIFSDLKLPAKVVGNMWLFPDDQLPPMLWYIQQLQWPTTMDDEAGLGASWLELALDFWAATFVSTNPVKYPSPIDLDIYNLQRDFGSMLRALTRLCGVYFDSRIKHIRPSYLLVCRTVGLPPLGGTAVRPTFLCPEMLSANLLRLVRASGIILLASMLPRFQLQLPPGPLWTTCLGVVNPASRTGAHSTVTAAQLREANDWTTAEQARIDATPTKHKSRTMKILRHNRSAWECGRHVVLPYDDPTGKALLKCRHCEWEISLGCLNRWMEPRAFPGESRCHRMAGARTTTAALFARNAAIDAHNLRLTASPDLHRVQRVSVNDATFVCLRCGSTVPNMGFTTSPNGRRALDSFLMQRCTGTNDGGSAIAAAVVAGSGQH